jgi:hypothetical protein
MGESLEKISFFKVLEVSVHKIKEIEHIVILLLCFAFSIIFYNISYNKDVLLGFILGFILTFGIGNFIFSKIYNEKIAQYNEEKQKTKEWEKLRNKTFNNVISGKIKKGVFSSIPSEE